MNEVKKEVFNVTETKDGVAKTTEYAVLRPRPADAREAQKAYNAAFADALRSNALTRNDIVKFMRERNEWDDEKEDMERRLVGELADLELKLQKGGIKLSEARDLALQMRLKRLELRDLIARRNQLDVNSAEGQAENARFNALVARCLVYNETGKPVYSDMDEYLLSSGTDVAFRGASLLAGMLYNVDKDHEASLPENKFLKKWKFVDDELYLINKDGQRVDSEGRRVDDEGYYIDDNGNRIDAEGRPIDKDGHYIVDAQPFLDDDGNPLTDPEATVAEVKVAPEPVVTHEVTAEPEAE